MMKLSKLRLGALAAFFAIFFAAVGAGTTLAGVQSHMIDARQSLNTALTQLQQSQADKGGHRNNAISLVKQAIDQVNQGIQVGK